MTWTDSTRKIIDRLSRARSALSGRFYRREEAVDVLALGAICHEHVLLLGPPGTAKTDLVLRFAAQIDAPRFHYLLTRFTEPAEIFGPLDMKAFQEGRYHINTQGMLPQATIAFLDEVFQGGSAILNTLLTLVHERVFHNGSATDPVPLMSLVGASNDLPEDTMLRAFADRFALRVHVEAVPDEGIGHLLDRGWEFEMERLDAERRASKGDTSTPVPALKADQIRELYFHLHDVKLGAVRPIYERILKELRAGGLELSDRRAVKGLKLIAGAALIAGREEATPADLWPLYHVWSRVADSSVLRGVVEPRVLEAGGATPPCDRAAAAVIADLEMLEAQTQQLRGETAVGAHLMALNRLRREAVLSHPDDKALVDRIEGVIRQIMALLEAAHV